MHKRPINHPYITRVNGVCAGEPVIKGTRIPVRIIFRHYELGKNLEDIQKEFPSISLAQISDALSYAFDHVKEIRRLIMEHAEVFCQKKAKKKSFAHS